MNAFLQLTWSHIFERLCSGKMTVKIEHEVCAQSNRGVVLYILYS